MSIYHKCALLCLVLDYCFRFYCEPVSILNLLSHFKSYHLIMLWCAALLILFPCFQFCFLEEIFLVLISYFSIDVYILLHYRDCKIIYVRVNFIF